MDINYKAILFDFDGVLAETMEELFLAWKNAFFKFNLDIKKEDYFILEGMKVLEIAKAISKKYLVNPNPSEIVKLKDEYYFQNNRFKFYNGIISLVESLKKNGKSLAVVSASSKEKLEKTVPKDFLEKFDAVVCSEDYFNGKPDPEPYLTAMKNLNVSPEECIVVENAPLGIKSAKKAGAYCIALTTTLDKEYLKEANVILNNHEELISYLKI
ncbi:HAD family phosphatase [Candidatus Pacearchaeota archaeon]|nr:HAD family phosphatase [Candidatus Pacearchaeota archaeon]